jgi:hypothetical protein
VFSRQRLGASLCVVARHHRRFGLLSAGVRHSLEIVMMLKNILILNCCITFLLAGCQDRPEGIVNNAFYYWRSTFELTESDIERLEVLHVQTLYVKFFDVDWEPDSRTAIPVAVTHFKTPLPSNIALIPTVFITNDTLKNLQLSEIEDLAHNILAKMERMLHTFPQHSIQEIQFDCDWTESTREKYFTFLQFAQTQNWTAQLIISATIRLHQIKYFTQTGVPPVSKGLLMCYNMGSPTNIETDNSIINTEQIGQYIQTLESYPLPLDVALPLFSWGVLFYHQEFVKLINSVREQNLLDHHDFVRHHNMVFRAMRNTYLQGQFIFKDSLIRVEEVRATDCHRSAILVAAKLHGKMKNVALFHYDPKIVQEYTINELLSIYSAF